jgi:hypothetical protein
VERVVDDDLGICARTPRVVRLDQRLLLGRNDKVNQHGRAAGRRGLRAVVEVVDGHVAHEGQLAVRVRVNAARHHELARSVDHARVARRRELLADRHDLAVLTQHVGHFREVVVHHQAVLDQQRCADRFTHCFN